MRYSFKAYDAEGRLEVGEVEAASRADALDAVARQGRYLLEVKEGGEAGALAAGMPRRLRISDQLALTRELASLAKARIPIDEALRLIAMQPGISDAGRRCAESVLDRLTAGASLSEAFAQQGSMPEHFWRLVRAGEASGTVPSVLDELATSIEVGVRIRAQVVSALLYPAFLLLASLITLAIVILILIPALAPVFQDSGAPLPPLIALLTGLRDWLSSTWWLVAGVVIAVAVAAPAVFRTPQVRELTDRLLTRVPLLSTLVTQHNTARLARIVALLTRNGIRSQEALPIAASLLSNSAYRASVLAAAEEINRGGSLIEPLRASGLYPPLALRLISVGESTGQLAAMLGRVADIYEHDLQQRVQRLVALAAPLATLVIGGLIGLLVISVMSAVVGLNEMALR